LNATIIGLTTIGMGLLSIGRAVAAPPVPYATVFAPGTTAETATLVKLAGTTLNENARQADPGQFLIYGFPVSAGARCRLNLVLEGDATPAALVYGIKDAPVPAIITREADNSLSIIWTVPAQW